ncbi:MAG TPA: polyprenyl synthetase family protein [Solirubrobacteraceae bacterium]|nr:polyprenyl synthetase family protein [Solirubrobacteraceae bacterium]
MTQPPGPAGPSGGFEQFARDVAPRVDREIERVVRREVDDPWMRGAIGYQFGWADAEFVPIAAAQRGRSGKRLRPLLAVLSYNAALERPDRDQATPGEALIVAAAVELIHNFSLIHDDIEDRDRSRRGRPTLWTLCGEAQAINAGDCVQALAYACVGRLSSLGVDHGLVGQIVHALAMATVDMTIGQRRDMAYERTSAVDADMYSMMIAGKTAALMSCATHTGALLAIGPGGELAAARAAGYAEFGRELGLCFQVRDDILGIWGSEADTGKSSGGDIRRRKKSLPIVLALGLVTGATRERLATLYALPTELDATQERDIRGILEDCDAQRLCQREAELHAELALRALATAEPAGANPFLATLRSLTGSLTARSS